ncbi:sugar ABC transporter substrate-binding protein [Actinotalea sp. K2]|uniref:ABC transporter substrate-binding protein n=1 Tax=Actinotalea sp. K2 TaxID=2939438 RepID=UPI0020173688|nr:sugar ABC transporter substrate-binding protein [Actinotalea sp. K2]MCL3861078.1 sugar ABC transporter substrate-binding protein [Actinotalea sp. K2]
MKLCSLPAARPSRRRATSGAMALTLSAALALTACGAGGADDDTSDDGAEGAAASGAITVLVEGGGLAELQPVADAWKSETGNEVTFVELPYGGLYDRLSTELASGSVSFDVAALDAIWLPAFADGVESLDEMFTDDVTADLFPALLEEASVDGRYIGMPVWTNAQVLFYRADLLEDPAEQTAFEAEYGYPLAAPTTWEEYRDVATFFTRDTDGDGATDLYGTDVKGAVETEWLASVLQAGADGMVLDADGNVIINDAAHKAALDFYVAPLLEDGSAPQGAAQIDWAAAQNLFYQGQTAMMRFWAHAYTQTPEDSEVFGKVGVAPMPAGPGGLAGVPGAWYLSVPTATKNTELAKEFIQFAFDNNALGLDTALGLAATKSALQSLVGVEGHENLAPLIETLEADGTMPRPATDKWQQIVDTVLIPMLQAAVAGGADNQQLLDDAKAQVEAILG